MTRKDSGLVVTVCLRPASAWHRPRHSGKDGVWPSPTLQARPRHDAATPAWDLARVLAGAGDAAQVPRFRYELQVAGIALEGRDLRGPECWYHWGASSS